MSGFHRHVGGGIRRGCRYADGVHRQEGGGCARRRGQLGGWFVTGDLFLSCFTGNAGDCSVKEGDKQSYRVCGKARFAGFFAEQKRRNRENPSEDSTVRDSPLFLGSAVFRRGECGVVV